MPRIVTWSPITGYWGAPYEQANVAVDLLRLGRMVRNELEPMPEVKTNADHHDLADLVRAGVPLAVDIETSPAAGLGSWTGKDPTLAVLRTVGIGSCTRGLSFMWSHASGSLRLLLEEVLADRGILKVFQNGPFFDLRVLSRYGLEVTNFVDTRDLRRALVSTSRLGLSYMASIYTDFPAWKVSDSDEKSWASEDEEELMEYNALDCVATARVYRGLMADLAEES